MVRLFFLIVCACWFSVQVSFAQVDMQAKLPRDKDVVTGRLSNGITYYLRHNAEPKARASFYIIRNAGALLENDDQNGLAHFLEHMAFNGTKNFPGKAIISTLERYGVSFGGNLNAYTAHNETVYNISAVPTTDKKLLDTCLLILHDWSYYLTLDSLEIDKERSVIGEEWRTRRDADTRIQQQVFSILYKGSKYAVRDVIGDLDVIRNFKYQTIRDFYHKWYRTDLEAIAVVGDFDVSEMEQKIKQLFSSIPVIKNAEVRPFYEIPEHNELYYCLATDKEQQNSSVSISTVFREDSVKPKNTVAYLKDNLVHSFYNNMIGTRIAELLQKGNPPFLSGNIGLGGMARGYYSYNISVVAKPNQEDAALEAILMENERVKRYGFTSGELDRLKTNTLVALESAYKSKDKTDNESFIEEIQDHFLEGEPMVNVDDYYRIIKQILPTITVEEVSAKAAEFNTDKNRTVIVVGPSTDAVHLTKAEVEDIMDKVAKADVQPYLDSICDASLVDEELTGSPIVSTKSLPLFNAVEWTLKNGVKVVFCHADHEKDAVSLTSYSKGGTSLYGIDMLPSAQNADGFVSAYGIGNFDAVALNKVLTGKMASCSVSIDNLSESVGASSTPRDFETMLQLVYLSFERPRFDRDVFETIMSRNRAAIVNMGKNPQKIMQDSVQLIMSNHHPRSLLFNEKYLDQISFEKIEQVYRDRIQNARDFTFFIVGNIDETIVKPLVEKYIGSLKSTRRKETWRDNQVRGPKGRTERVIEVEFETPKATAIVHFSKDMKSSVYGSLCNSILQGILELRYTENIREKEGGTYGVSVQADNMREPYSNYSMTMSFDCDPDKVSHLKSLIYVEVEKIMREPPVQEEMNKVVLNLKKEAEQSKNHNDYWMSVISTYYVSGINLDDPRNFEKILDKITVKDIQKFARRLFTDADVVDLIFKSK